MPKHFETEYRDYTIQFSPNGFKGTPPGATYRVEDTGETFVTLKEAEAHIRARFYAKTAYVPTRFIDEDSIGYPKLTYVTVVALGQDGTPYYKKANGATAKMSSWTARNLILETPENLAIIAKINEADKKIEELEKAKDKLERGIKRWNGKLAKLKS